MNHEYFINHICKGLNAQSYLELGLYKGECITEIAKHVPVCVGVDIVDVPATNYEFHKTTTTDFFKNNIRTFDVIFIDADHKFESARGDLLHSLTILNKGGVIIMHDTDPSEKYLIDPGYCGDSYKIIDWIKNNKPELNHLTLPIEKAGLTIINRNTDRRVLNWI